MHPVARFEVVLLLLAIVVGLELLARRLRVPPAAALVVGGIALALLPGAPNIAIDPELMLVLFLPPLLMAGAYITVWRDFRDNLRVIVQLAVGAVAFTTLVVGCVAHWAVPGLPWAACFALGAIVSPPDAVAAKAVLARLRLPPRIVVLLEGESLVNDASGLVLFRFAVAAALTGAFSPGEAAVSFLVLAIGGVAAGLAFGAATTALVARLHDPTLAAVGSLLAAWAAYIVGDAIGVSGVLATVACGLVVGSRQHTSLSAATRTSSAAVWKSGVFILESLVFILIGLQLRGVLARLGGWEASTTWLPATAAIIAAVVLSRFAWVVPTTYLFRALLPGLRRRDPFPPLAVPVLISWAGMRGVVSLAAALSLPDGFPGRDFIVAATFAVILVTVLLQGLTLAPLIRVLRLGQFELGGRPTLSEAEARARVAAAQLAAVEQLSAADGTPAHPRLQKYYSFRAEAAARFSTAEGALAGARIEHFRTILAAVQAGRAEALRLHRLGDIHERVLYALEDDLDLEELVARRVVDGEQPLPEVVPG